VVLTLAESVAPHAAGGAVELVAVPAGTVIEAVACVHDAAMAGVPICWYVATPAAVRNSANIVVAAPARYQVLNVYVWPATTPTGLNRHPA